jgi:thiol-disulfide isomerase/thioredoxin
MRVSQLLTLLLIIATFSTEAQELQDQKKLPDATIEDLEGAKVNIQKFSNNDKITIITFWATWCTPCKKEMTNLSELYPYWKEDYNAEIVAVSIDDSRNSAKVKSYVNGQAWDFTFLLDSNQDLKRALNFQTIPYTIMVDSEGYIVYTHQGYVEGDEYTLEDKMKKLTQEEAEQ